MGGGVHMRMYGIHMQVVGMMDMFVPTIAKSLILANCPHVTRVKCHIAWIATLTHTHRHTGVLFGACQLVTLHTQPKAKQARSSVTLPSHGLLLPPPGLGTTPRVIQNVGTYP